MANVLLRALDLHKTYGAGSTATEALKGVSFDLEHGEFAAIVGRSGSGKSTLLNLIGLLDTPTAGQLWLDGRETGPLSMSERAGLRNESLGFVFQFHYLLPEFSVLENVLMPARIAGRREDELLRRQVGETIELLGLQGLEHKNANELSGGQKQRVAIGRALVNRPALVLADEPTGNLDSETSQGVQDLFRRVNAEWGTAFLIVTHDRHVAEETDRILEVVDGRLMQDIRLGDEA